MASHSFFFFHLRIKFDWHFEAQYHTRTRVHISYTLSGPASDVAARQAGTSWCENPESARQTLLWGDGVLQSSHHIAGWQRTIGQEITASLHTFILYSVWTNTWLQLGRLMEGLLNSNGANSHEKADQRGNLYEF